MIDAAGAIYVIGGTNYGTYGTSYPDVWASTDGGARPDYAKAVVGGTGWVLTGVLRGYHRGTTGGTKG